MLQVQALTLRMDDRLLFDAASLTLNAGKRAGLVGRNGSGKSTLLSLIKGDRDFDSGAIEIHPRARVGLVAQEAPSGEEAVIDAVLSADEERERLLARAEAAKTPQDIADVQNRLAEIRAHTALARAAAILAGVGFSDDQQKQHCSLFSGGWRMRIALAQALFSAPDLLLLDEPTNYLDLEGTIWLEQFLRGYEGTVLLVSHDRELLNGAVDEIVHLRGGKLKRYVGNYESFERQRREEQRHRLKLRDRQEDERRRLQAYIDRFRAKSHTAKQAQSRIKALQRLKPVPDIVEERTPVFRFPDISPPSPPIILMDEVSTGYDEKRPVLRDISLSLGNDERIAVLGPNGNGKSTFAKLLADELPAFSGRVRRAKKMTTGFFTQHQLDQLNERQTAYEHVAAKRPDDTEAECRAHLGAFGFEQRKADVKVANLSGGEKARLVFALLALEAPQLLILDEPTNHLDVDAREALIRALNDFDGALVLISHDRHLIETCCDSLYRVADGTVRRYDGTLADYREEMLRQRTGDSSSRADKSGGEAGRKRKRRTAAQARRALSPLRKTAEKAQARVEALQQTHDKIAAALADPRLYEAEHDEDRIELSRKFAELERAIESAEAAWLAAMEELERAEAQREES